MEELHCRFLGVTVRDEVAAAAADGSLADGEGFAGGESNGSGSGWVPFLGVVSMLSKLEEAWIFEVV